MADQKLEGKDGGRSSGARPCQSHRVPGTELGSLPKGSHTLNLETEESTLFYGQGI